MTVIERSAMSADEARERVDRVRTSVAQSREDLKTLHRERAWLSLGYASWDDLCDAEFGVRLALPREERREVVADLRAEGMSTRAIGSALGVPQRTIADDVRRVSETAQTPTRITSLDGRLRPATRPPAPPRPAPTIAEALADDPGIEAAEFRRNLSRAINEAMMLAAFDPQRTADLAENVHTDMIAAAARQIAEWSSEVARLRSGLRVVTGVRA